MLYLNIYLSLQVNITAPTHYGYLHQPATGTIFAAQSVSLLLTGKAWYGMEE